MATYQANPTGAQLWTKAGNKAGIMPAGTQFESNGNLTIKDNFCRLVESGGYIGKYAQANDVTLVNSPPPAERFVEYHHDGIVEKFVPENG